MTHSNNIEEKKEVLVKMKYHTSVAKIIGESEKSYHVVFNTQIGEVDAWVSKEDTEKIIN